MARSEVTGSSRRLWLLVAALGLMLGVWTVQLAFAAPSLTKLPLFDFVEYWAAGRLLADGENPYDLDRVQQLEREAGRDEDAILMWNPPWTLPLVLPFGVLDVRTAHLLWLLTHLAALLLSADVLWRYYGGSAEHRWVAWLAAFSFLPTYFALAVGQITPLMLLGAVLFLHAERSGRLLLAGVACGLLAIKPQLAYLFWIALALWVVDRRRWLVAGGAAFVLLALTAKALTCNPAVLTQYWDTLAHRPPAQYHSPTWGTALRLLVGEGSFGLQFVPMVPGLVWFALHWLRHRRGWDWSEQMPLLLLVSMLTASYGAWPFDLVLLLVPVVQIAALLWERGTSRVWQAAVAAHLGVTSLAIACTVAGLPYFWFIWMTPALLGLYLLFRRAAGPTPAVATASASA